MTASAQLVFEGQPTVVLPRLLELVRSGLRSSDAEAGRVTEASLTALTFSTEGLDLTLSMALTGAETRVTIALSLDETATPRAALARLAPLVYAALNQTDAAAVIWNDTSARIPRQMFLDGLADSLTPREAAPAVVRPRRITRPAQRSRALRPDAAQAPALHNTHRAADSSFDAHVLAFEAHLTQELRRGATSAELDALRLDATQAPRRVSALASNAMQSAELRAAALVTTVATLVLTSGATQMV